MAHPVPILAALGGIAVTAIVAAGQTGGNDKGPIYGGAVAGLVLGIVGYLAKDYLSHKGTSAQQAAADREAFRKQAEADRAAFQGELHDLSDKLNEVNHAIMGISGRGGLLTDREMDQQRRHELGNHVHRLTLVVAEVLRILTDVAGRQGIQVDPNLAKAIERKDSER